jgi:uncharacterized protein (DUF952 family)
MIYHITTYDLYAKFIDEDFYEAPSLKTEGFIHCSTAKQLEATIQRYYKNEAIILILHLNEQKLTSPLKYEMADSVQEEFPHIYGAINKDAIDKMERRKQIK